MVGCSCREVGSFVYRNEFDNGLVEFEYDHVLVGEWTGDVVPNPEEADDVAWVPIDDVARHLIAEPHVFTCWFMTAAPMALKAIREGCDLTDSPLAISSDEEFFKRIDQAMKSVENGETTSAERALEILRARYGA